MLPAVADLPTWLTAGGTIATSIVALGLALGSPYLAERYNRVRSPRLKVTFEDADVDPRVYGSPNHVRYRLKIKVANTGPTSAQGVRAYVTDYVAKTYPQVGQRPFARFAIDPVPLPWISRPPALSPDLREQVTIATRMSQSAAVALYDSLSARLSILDTTSKLFTPPMPENPVTFAHWLTLHVMSDNARPCSATIYFETSIPTPTHKLSDPVAARLAEALPSDDQIADWEAVDHEP
jgi:hypothetical protein